MSGPAAQDLVEAAMHAFGVTSDDDLAIELRLRYGVRVKQSTVNRWRNGKSSPSYEATVALLDAVGWLNPNPEVPRNPAEPVSSAARLESIAAGIKNLALNQEVVMDALGVSEADRVRPALDEEPPQVLPIPIPARRRRAGR